MGCFKRAIPTLLLHVNLLLMLFAGALLLTAARLKWDPTAYVAPRELFPREYRVASVVLPILGFVLLLLAQMVLVALRCQPSIRRVLLILYAVTMLVLLWGEISLGSWAAWRASRWARGPHAAELKRALALREDVHPLLEHLSYYHPLPEKVNRLIREAEVDLPRYGRAMLSVVAMLAILQLLAAVLALLAASEQLPESDSDTTRTTSLSSRNGDVEKTPLRAGYKNGKLVIL